MGQQRLDLIPEVHRLRNTGLNKTEIGNRLGLSRDAVRRLLAKAPDTEPAEVKWGHGAAKPVKPATREATEVVVFGSDFHFPYQDDRACDSFLQMIAAVQPHRVVLNGDIADFFQLSRFNTTGLREEYLQDEIDQANEFRRAVRDAAPDAMIDETEGNHDNRVRSYVGSRAGALSSLRALKPAELFGYREHQINWHPGCGFLLRPNFLVKHGTMVRGEAGATAKAELAAAGISGISGHTHRLARYRRAGYVQRVWVEQGCFCRLDPDYIVGQPNWQQGCAVGEFSTKGDGFVLHEVPYADGKLRFGRESW